MQQCFVNNGFVNYCWKLFILDVCGVSSHNPGNSGTWTKYNKNKLQHAKTATGEEPKTKTLHCVKVHHEIVQCIKRVKHEKIVTWKDYYIKKCHMEML